MDTPQKNQICSPVTKYEDSPVFNYLNNLSPIKPVRTLHTSQTLNSLSFSSPPSVFTSPHISFQKEPSIFKRQYLPSSSGPEISSNDEHESNTSGRSLEGVRVSDSAVVFSESCDLGMPIGEAVGPTTETAELPIELPRVLNYDCGGIKNTEVPRDPQTRSLSIGHERDPEEVVVKIHSTFKSEIEPLGTYVLKHTKEEETRNGWETLISESADVLIYDSSSKREGFTGQKIFLHSESNSYSLGANLLQHGSEYSTNGNQNLMEQTLDQLEGYKDQKEADHTPHILSNTFQSTQGVPCDGKDEKTGYCTPLGCKQQRGIRRRCLVFDSAGAQKKNLVDARHSTFFRSLSDGKIGSCDTNLAPFKPSTGSSPCMLPGIGLHLNALATSTKDSRVIKHESLPSGKRLISMPASSTAYCFNKLVTLNSNSSDMALAGNDQILQDESSGLSVGEEINENSPRNKRCKMDQIGDNSCKRCNCKKSKCLKLYCECFAAGVYCVEPCSCHDCLNKPTHEDIVLATRKQIETRNPLAFAPKVVRNSRSVLEIGVDSGKTPASARHKRGCNCKKSSCLKKYCECYQGGVGCSINCRCDGCRNTFGIKDGITSLDLEEPQDVTGISDKNSMEESAQHNETEKDEGRYLDHVLPIKFSFDICRTTGEMPFPSIGNLAYSAHPPQPKFEKHSNVILDDETPEVLRGYCSPVSGVKTLSPSRKRVSPPHSGFESTSGPRSSRKLLLQSIPSFPSLTHHESDDMD